MNLRLHHGARGGGSSRVVALEPDEGAADTRHAYLDALRARVRPHDVYVRWTADERDELAVGVHRRLPVDRLEVEEGARAGGRVDL